MIAFKEFAQSATSVNKAALKLFLEIIVPQWEAKHPAGAADLTASMEHAHEQLKIAGDAASVASAIAALSGDVNNKSKVYIAENTHRRIANKLNNADEAKRYYE